MKNFLNNNKLNIFFCIISGLGAAASFDFSNLWWLCLFAFTPITFVFLNNKSKSFKHIFLYCFIYNFSLYIPALYWIYEINDLLPFNKIISCVLLFLGTVAIITIISIYLYISLIVFKTLQCLNIFDTIFLSFSFIINEYMSEIFIFLSFPWFKISVIPTAFPVFIQTASIFGEKIITFIVVFINSLIAYSFINRRKKKKVILSCIISTVLLTLNLVYGYSRITNYKAPTELKAMVVQGNYVSKTKWDKSPCEIIDEYSRLTKSYISDDVKLILWPETVIPDDFNNDIYYKQSLVDLSKELNATIIIGAFTKCENLKFNSLIAISPDGFISKPYCKRYLAPYGEYIPMYSFFCKILPDSISSLIPNCHITSSKIYQILNCNGFDAGGIICYDSVFSGSSLKNVKNGAGVLTIATNDSWFGDSKAMYQHHAHSKMRAVESNRYVMNAANTGVSSIISPCGKVLEKADPLKVDTIIGFIDIINTDSFYIKHPNMLIILIILSYIICVIVKIKKK